MTCAAVIVLMLSTVALADELPPLDGRVVDLMSGLPVEGAVVTVHGPAGILQTLATDADGRYRTTIAQGTYRVLFTFGKASLRGEITVGRGGATLDCKLDAKIGEVIEIEGEVAPPVPPKATNHAPRAAPPYSEAAILRAVWTKAHMLLDIDEHGTVVRYKFLRRPGHDLEKIAARQVSKLKFEPAKDGRGQPMRAYLVWTIEWPSVAWLEMLHRPRTWMPPPAAYAKVPCEGSGPWRMGSQYKGYRDCSQPDLRAGATERWEPSVAPSAP